MDSSRPLDVVWLKRDVRLSDHGPFSAVLPRVDRDVLVLYLYEPDQLRESSVHGSHVAFCNEGLLDLDRRLYRMLQLLPPSSPPEPAEDDDGPPPTEAAAPRDSPDPAYREFQCLTVCHAEIVATLEAIQASRHISRLFAHMETGHMASFVRDKRVRKWCKGRRIPFVELVQSGVTRCLRDRDDFAKLLHKFTAKAQHRTPDRIGCRLVCRANPEARHQDDNKPLLSLPGQTHHPLFEELEEIPPEHRVDRPSRSQTGGETKARLTLRSFLASRGQHFSKGISSPNSSWNSCSRLSPYLTWGHVSLRAVIQALQDRQNEIRLQNKSRSKKNTSDAISSQNQGWPRSLSAFSSRLHWRSHFIQKLESEPELEKRDICPAYQHLRRQPGDWNEDHYRAWASGRTGFPLVDACMRCLLAHGWLNFRMRAMLVSFGTYNLWLDWKRLAPHLARVFLDYEPGIHYPQLQMQAGTTGINAMRVYSVTKQAKDQDPQGIFIRKYVPELSRVPNKFIHEPWKLTAALQQECGCYIGVDYPAPIVNEQESARTAKQRISEVRKKEDTKRMAQQVFLKHGSRASRRPDGVPGQVSPAKRRKTGRAEPSSGGNGSSTKDSDDANKNAQSSITAHFLPAKATTPSSQARVSPEPPSADDISTPTSSAAASAAVAKPTSTKITTNPANSGWACDVCTFIHHNPLFLVCSMCGSQRKT